MNTVATLNIPAGTIHDASYECAAWYRTFEHDAQTVEIRQSGDWFVYTIQGRTTHEHFPSLFGGVATGGGTVGDCDKPATVGRQLRNYELAAMVEAGTVTLSDGYHLVETYHDHPVSCSGYVTDYTQPIGHRYSPCEHDHHLDAHMNPTVTERNERGNLPFGYVPGVVNRKRHVHVRPN